MWSRTLPGRAARLACCACFLSCLLVLTAGCTNPYKVKQVDVTGKVLFKGAPLPGGRVTFSPAKRGGGVPVTANIDEQGQYKIKAPVGECQIAVDNRMFQPPQRRGPVPNKPAGLKRPGAEAPSELKGHYVEIPSKYHDPTTSELKYKVEDKDPQTHDIVLD